MALVGARDVSASGPFVRQPGLIQIIHDDLGDREFAEPKDA